MMHNTYNFKTPRTISSLRVGIEFSVCSSNGQICCLSMDTCLCPCDLPLPISEQQLTR